MPAVRDNWKMDLGSKDIFSMINIYKVVVVISLG